MSGPGKAAWDLNQGFLTQDQYDAAAVKAPVVDLSNSNFGERAAPVNEDYMKKRNEGFAAQMATIEETEASARRASTSLAVMSSAMKEPGFYSGSGAEAVRSFKRLNQALGWGNPEGVDAMETFNAQAKSAALDVMGGSLGTGFSNADRDFVLDQVPSLDVTPQGNAMLIEVQSALNNRKIEIAKHARDYERTYGQIDRGFNERLAAWAEENPVFTEDWLKNFQEKHAVSQPEDSGFTEEELKFLRGGQ